MHGSLSTTFCWKFGIVREVKVSARESQPVAPAETTGASNGVVRHNDAILWGVGRFNFMGVSSSANISSPVTIRMLLWYVGWRQN